MMFSPTPFRASTPPTPTGPDTPAPTPHPEPAPPKGPPEVKDPTEPGADVPVQEPDIPKEEGRSGRLILH